MENVCKEAREKSLFVHIKKRVKITENEEEKILTLLEQLGTHTQR